VAAVVVIGLEDQPLRGGADVVEQVHFTAEVIGVFVSDDARPRHVRADRVELLSENNAACFGSVNTANSAFL
jgi:hypothetical protein